MNDMFLARGSTYKDFPGSKNGFDLSLFIKDILVRQGALPSGDTCCFGSRNTFIEKKYVGKGSLNLEKIIIDILTDLGVEGMFLQCCNPKYDISKTILSTRNHPGFFSIKDLVKKILTFHDVPHGDNCCETIIEVPMRTFLSTNTPGYPVGVFNVNGDFVGTANNQTEYLTLWNADLDNIAQGSLLAGSTSLTFKINVEAAVTEVIGLRYYEYTGPANLQLFVGDNDIVHYGSTIKKGNVDGISITNTTRKEWNRNVTFAIKSTVPTDTVRTLNCTGYVDSASLKVFHNEDSEYAAVSHSNGFYTIAGNYPLGLKAVYYAGRMATNYNNILNWGSLNSFFSWYSFSVGGTVWGMTPENFPLATIIKNNITQIGVGEDTSTPTTLTGDYPYLTATNFPNLQDLVIAYNTGDALTGSAAWFLTMPKVTNYFKYQTQTLTQVAAAEADAIWNNVATALSGVVPAGPAKELRIIRTNNITAASLASRNALISAGWTVTTN